MRQFIFPPFLGLIVSLSIPLAGAAQNNRADSVRSGDSMFVTIHASNGKDTTITAKDAAELIEKTRRIIPPGSPVKVEIESQFPGGPTAWLAFINSHLEYPKKAARKKIEGTVMLQFIVDKDGSISDLKALSGDPLLAEAALKAMADSPRWKPAVQNGKLVKSYKKQPVVFKLDRPN
jgi:periplasmic protein TonB